MTTDYKCVTTVAGIQEYIGSSTLVAFDFETAPDDDFRNEERAALDPAKSHICTLSLSIAKEDAIMIPVAHKIGPNMPEDVFYTFLRNFLTNPDKIKVAHNISF